LLIGVRGKIPCPAMGEQFDSAIEAPKGEHSEKPDFQYEIAEHYFPTLPKIELNARRAREGWIQWGFDAPVSAVVFECHRQRDVEGWSIEHDDEARTSASWRGPERLLRRSVCRCACRWSARRGIQLGRRAALLAVVTGLVEAGRLPSRPCPRRRADPCRRVTSSTATASRSRGQHERRTRRSRARQHGIMRACDTCAHLKIPANEDHAQEAIASAAVVTPLPANIHFWDRVAIEGRTEDSARWITIAAVEQKLGLRTASCTRR
jgi:hypothetical protein